MLVRIDQKNHKATKPAIIGTPVKRHLYGVSLAGRRWPVYSGICLDHLSPKKSYLSWTQSEKTFWVRSQHDR